MYLLSPLKKVEKWNPDRVINTESAQTGTQSFTKKAQRDTEKNSVKLCVSSVLSVFPFVRVTRSGKWNTEIHREGKKEIHRDSL